MKNKDYYKILDVSTTAKANEISEPISAPVSFLADMGGADMESALSGKIILLPGDILSDCLKNTHHKAT